MNTEPTLRLLSLGAGVQSTVLGLMAADGTLPGLDAAIFADTGWEPARVYKVVDKLEAVLNAAGIPLHRVSNGNLRNDAIDPAHRYASIPYFVLNRRERQEPIRSSGITCPDCDGSGWVGGGLRNGQRAIDAHPTIGEPGDDTNPDMLCRTCGGRCVTYREHYPVVERQEGMGRRQCTSEYKLAPINRKVRELLGAAAPDYRRVPRGRVAEQWIGFSTDEIGRVSDKDGVSYVHKRYPLLELGMNRAACERYLHQQGWGDVAKSACIGCLATETEVITDIGVRQIGSLVDPETGVGRATLLIPRPRSGWGSWREVDVRSFGVQRLYQIELVRRRERKTVFATAEHRWKRKHPKTGVWSDFVTTLDLAAGDRLPVSLAQGIRASGENNAAVSPIGVAAGFTFGDGSRTARRNGPAWADFYGDKDLPLLPYFAALPTREHVGTHGERFVRAYGAPRAWKDLPPLNEARGYLLGWLAGYFAADGHVTKQGQAVLSSARQGHLVHVRDVCNILGVRTGRVRTKEHSAIGGRTATLHEVGIYFRDLPLDFWLIPEHRRRVADRSATAQERRDDWTVREVVPTDRVEEVFCAVVPGEEMFVLADGLATGNCPFHGNRQWRELRDNYPDEWADAVDFDRAIRKGGARGLPLDGEAFLHRSRVPLSIAPIDRLTVKERSALQGDLFAEMEDGDPDGCSPYGCRSGVAA